MLAFAHATSRVALRTARPLVCAPSLAPSRAISVVPRRFRPRRRVLLMVDGAAATGTEPGPAVPGSTGESDDAPPVHEEVDPGAVEGTDLRVLRYPHPLLRAENATVGPDGFDESLRQTAREMLLVMYASQGVGLAAPQVGVNKRLLVFNPEGRAKAFLQEVVMVNPRIVATSKKTDVETEACLSFPGMGGDVRRHEWVKVEAFRLNGKKFRTKFEGWKARIFQHEYDHLEGVMYVDRLGEEDRKKVAERLGELISQYEEDPYEGMGPAL